MPDAVRAANVFNKAVKVGAAVEYREVRDSTPFVTTTRSTAWVLGGHTAVVMLTGKAGGVAIDHVTVLS